jgi:transposase
MIRKKTKDHQTSLWIATDELQVKPKLAFFEKLNSVLDKIEFGQRIRKLCQPYYSDREDSRPPIDPEVYFKMLIIGFFENLRSERGIAARCADSLSIRAFLGYLITEPTPEQSSLSKIRYRLPLIFYFQVFDIVLKAMKDNGLVKGKNLAFDTSIMEANASLLLLKNRMTKESYAEYIKELARQSGINPEDKAAVARFDRKRKGRKTSNKEWYNPFKPDAKIGQTKDGATDMIYKTEHAVDLDTGAILDADVLFGDMGDPNHLSERIINTQSRLSEISDNPIEEKPAETITTDKGYYNVQELTEIQSHGIDTVIPDKDFKRNMSKLTDEEALAVESAKLLVNSKAGRALLRRRGSHVERSFAHVLDCGGMRRTTLKGITNNRKRYIIAVACYNLSLLMRTIFGIGTLKQSIANAKLLFILFMESIIRLQNRLLAFIRMIFFLTCLRTFIIRFSLSI